MTDTSTPQQRSAFATLLEAGTPSPTLTAAVANSPVILRVESCYLLGLPENSTYAQAAALLQFRWANSETAP